jgi:hypothetical protein
MGIKQDIIEVCSGPDKIVNIYFANYGSLLANFDIDPKNQRGKSKEKN